MLGSADCFALNGMLLSIISFYALPQSIRESLKKVVVLVVSVKSGI